ncbi:SEC-C metal-binding domain-containing protein [Candidatus Halobeggiatoa sp. HSG11]|nr:SEC-C metal-binding domain-containing protein [Candidatus Halobeggiatoa sp. HSG11]
MNNKYTSPVSKLLTYGNCLTTSSTFEKWPNYLELGFNEKHIPQLMTMVTDDELNDANSDGLEVWAPTHAWRTLGQLQAVEAVEPLLNIDSRFEEDEWISEELPYVFGLIGENAIPMLTEYLADDSNDDELRSNITTALSQIGKMHPETRTKCIAVLTQQLEKHADNDPEFNSYLILALTDLKAVESLPVIKNAYAQENVDHYLFGDYEDAEIYIGIREKRDTEREYGYFLEEDKPIITTKSKEIEPNAPIKTITKSKKIGRNEPCPCGSGKKYKKCCLGSLVA